MSKWAPSHLMFLNATLSIYLIICRLLSKLLSFFSLPASSNKWRTFLFWVFFSNFRLYWLLSGAMLFFCPSSIEIKHVAMHYKSRPKQVSFFFFYPGDGGWLGGWRPAANDKPHHTPPHIIIWTNSKATLIKLPVFLFTLDSFRMKSNLAINHSHIYSFIHYSKQIN